MTAVPSDLCTGQYVMCAAVSEHLERVCSTSVGEVHLCAVIYVCVQSVTK